MHTRFLTPTRRALIEATWRLALGLVLSVVVAWGCIVLSPAHEDWAVYGNPWPLPPLEHWEPPFVKRTWGRGVEVNNAVERIRPDGLAGKRKHAGMQFVLRAGWPWPSVTCSQSQDHDWFAPQRRLDDSIALAPWPALRLPGWCAPPDEPWRRYLPLGLVWPGAAFDALFFAGVVWGASFFVPLVLVKARLRPAGYYLTGWLAGAGSRRPVAFREALVAASVLRKKGSWGGWLVASAVMLLGAILISVGIAAGCALLSPVGAPNEDGAREGMGIAMCTKVVPSAQSSPPGDDLAAVKNLIHRAWQRKNPRIGSDEITIVQAGWPWACAKWEKDVIDPDDPARRLQQGILVRRAAVGAGLDIERRLPLWPLWPGLAANAGATWMVLVAGLIVVRLTRGMLRARRHRCPACGYPHASGDNCTECGLCLLPPSARWRMPIRFGGRVVPESP